MKKLIRFSALSLIALFICVDSFAAVGTVRRIFNAQTVAATGTTAVSNGFSVKSGGYFGVWYQATSASGTPNLKFVYEMSYDDTSANYATPNSVAAIDSALTSESVQVESISPPPMPYLRFRLTGNATNATDTTVTAYLFEQAD